MILSESALKILSRIMLSISLNFIELNPFLCDHEHVLWHVRGRVNPLSCHLIVSRQVSKDFEWLSQYSENDCLRFWIHVESKQDSLTN